MNFIYPDEIRCWHKLTVYLHMKILTPVLNTLKNFRKKFQVKQ